MYCHVRAGDDEKKCAFRILTGNGQSYRMSRNKSTIEAELNGSLKNFFGGCAAF